MTEPDYDRLNEAVRQLPDTLLKPMGLVFVDGARKKLEDEGKSDARAIAEAEFWHSLGCLLLDERDRRQATFDELRRQVEGEPVGSLLDDWANTPEGRKVLGTDEEGSPDA